MSMRVLWFLLFVLAPLATLAGYGSTYGIGSAGGGVTVGNAVSGGTASRLLHTDASGNVATANPALGAGLTLTGALQGTSSNFTGQMVFDGAAVDVSTGTNQNWTVDPNGTGIVELNADVTMTDTAMTLILDSSTSGNSSLINFNTAASSRMQLGASSTTVGWWRMLSASAPAVIYNSNNTAAGVSVLEVGDNNSSATAITKLFTVDGVGALRIPANTSAHGTTCNSSSEGTFYYRTIAASNKSGVCMCAQTSSGVYAWKAAITFGSSALTDGDC